MKKEENKKDNRALYRKYRGRSLSEIIGQEHVTSSLQKGLETGNISHAYLFSGPRGVGKTSVARVLAHLVNDLPYQDDTTHLDIIEIDAASNRRIEDARDLREKIHIAPVQARYKVYIIDEVHMLTRESFNALLKILEEPPEYVIFILATTEPHKLPETIISRTQHYQFRPMDKIKAAKHLEQIAKKEKLQIDPSALELLAEHGRGSMRDSVSMLDQLASSGQKITVQLVEEVLGLVSEKAIDSLVSILKSGDIAELATGLENILAEGIDASLLSTQIYKALKNQVVSDPNQNLGFVGLMQALLEVPKSFDSNLALETTLLKFMIDKSDRPEKPNKENKAVTRDAAITPPKSNDLVIKPPRKNSQPSAKKTIETAQSEQPPARNSGEKLELSLWQQIIDDIKETNNTLAGLLRQTEAQLHDQTLNIACPYSFHVKRLKTSAYLSRLTKSVHSVLGDGISLDIYHLASNSQPKAEDIITIETAPTDPKLQAIQNIMGGGEIINV